VRYAARRIDAGFERPQGAFRHRTSVRSLGDREADHHGWDGRSPGRSQATSTALSRIGIATDPAMVGALIGEGAAKEQTVGGNEESRSAIAGGCGAGTIVIS